MEKAPLFDAIAEGPEGGQAYWLTCPDGPRIRMGHWPKAADKDARGTVLLFPGRSEYVEKYGPAAAAYAAQGFDLVTIDWRGQGLADRVGHLPLIGHIDDFDEFQTDTNTVMDAVRELGLPEPYYLIGHSMGGCIGLRALHNGLPVNAAAFSGPMWGIGLSPVLMGVARVLSPLLYRLGHGLKQSPGTKLDTYVQIAPFEDNQLTRDPEMWAFMQRQLKAQPDLALGAPSVSWLYHALKETDALQDMAPPDVATLTFLGTNERIVAKRPVIDMMKRWPDSELIMVQDGEHEIMMEVPATRENFFARTSAFFAEHS